MALRGIEIRPATADDLESSRDRLPDLLVDHWRAAGNRRSFVAVRDDVVVGHCRGIDNKGHPDSRVLVVEVLPDHRRQGIGTALLTAQLQVSTQPLHLKIYAPMSAERALARDFGGVAVQATPPWRYPMTPELRTWPASHAGPAETPNADDGPEVLDLEVQHYVDQHAAWSPADAIAVREEFAADFAPGSPSVYDPDHSTVLRRDGRIVAAALIWPQDAEERFSGHEVSPLCRHHGSAAGRSDMEQCLAGVIDRCADDVVLLIDSHLTETVEAAMLRDLPGLSAPDPDDWMAIVAIPVPDGPAPIAMPSGLLPAEARWIEDEFVRPGDPA